MLRKEEKPYKVVLLTLSLWVMRLPSSRTPVNVQKFPMSVQRAEDGSTYSSISDPCWSGIIPGGLDSPKHLDCTCPQDGKTSEALPKVPRHKSVGGGWPQIGH